MLGIALLGTVAAISVAFFATKVGAGVARALRKDVDVYKRQVNAGFVPVRKPGKLPRETVSASYDLEYGKNEVHIHADSIKPGENVVIIDDLLATGGTVEATIDVYKRQI